MEIRNNTQQCTYLLFVICNYTETKDLFSMLIVHFNSVYAVDIDIGYVIVFTEYTLFGH